MTSSQPLFVNFGCGYKKLPGYVGLDCLSTPAVDIVHDMNKYPYPF